MANQKSLSNEEIASFFRQTSMLFSAGIGPRDAMQILLGDSKNEKGRELITQIRDTCRKGETFSTALSETKVFPDYVINMISLGEESGKTDTCMIALAEFYEKEQAISESLRGALTYPVVMLIMMLVVIIVLVGKVMPIFQQVFNELGTDMTGFAGSMLKIGQALNNYSIVFLCIFGVLVLFYIISNHTAAGRKISHNFLVHFPLTKGFYESVACERFASSLAIAISSGMDTYSGLDMAKRMVEHPKMCEKIDKCKNMIREGS
ncbi:MAG: type II secretion system F family protein, partial [Lachnospiraceae bacterium]|nr:type II secretion system F family protein [Lachnospiraceae bacterium]